MLRSRSRTRHERRDDARTVGFEAAVGMHREDFARVAEPEGRSCSHCGAVGRIDMVDTARARAYLTCLQCGHEWDAARVAVTGV